MGVGGGRAIGGEPRSSCRLAARARSAGVVGPRHADAEPLRSLPRPLSICARARARRHACMRRERRERGRAPSAPTPWPTTAHPKARLACATLSPCLTTCVLCERRCRLAGTASSPFSLGPASTFGRALPSACSSATSERTSPSAELPVRHPQAHQGWAATVADAMCPCGVRAAEHGRLLPLVALVAPDAGRSPRAVHRRRWRRLRRHSHRRLWQW